MFSSMPRSRQRFGRRLPTALVAAGSLAALTFGSASPAAADTVVASWEFDQVVGVVPDLLPGANHLTLSGDWSAVPGAGADLSAIRFEGAPATAATTDEAGQNFNPGEAPFALTVQFRVTDDVTWGSPNVAQHGRFNNPGQIKMQLKSGGRVGCRIKGDRGAYLITHPTADVNDNEWHTVSCARDLSGTDVSVTVDGVAFSPDGSEDPGSIVLPNSPMRFAQKDGSSSRSDQFVGDIGFASYSL